MTVIGGSGSASKSIRDVSFFGSTGMPLVDAKLLEEAVLYRAHTKCSVTVVRETKTNTSNGSSRTRCYLSCYGYYSQAKQKRKFGQGKVKINMSHKLNTGTLVLPLKVFSIEGKCCN